MLQLISGVNIPIPELQVSIHQPSILEISYLGEEQYFSALQMLCFNKQILAVNAPELEQMNNFDIFMTLTTDPNMKDVAQKKNMIMSIFTLLFPNYTVQFLPHSLFFNNAADKHSFVIY